MSVLAHFHERFNVHMCRAYIHTLRWQDRPLPCPRCQSQNVGLWGDYHYRPGVKRYWCQVCRRTVNDLTHTLWAQSKGHVRIRDETARVWGPPMCRWWMKRLGRELWSW
jgi:transposase-like protein